MTADSQDHSELSPQPPPANWAAADEALNLNGLSCPMPLLKAKLALNKMAGGARLLVQATDPGSVRDFEVFAQQSGNELLCHEARDVGPHTVYLYLLQKKQAS